MYAFLALMAAIFEVHRISSIISGSAIVMLVWKRAGSPAR